MQKEIAIIISLAILLVPACTASATDYYVDVKTGDDWENNGRSPDDAWKSITFALERGVTGSQDDPAVLHIAAGTYTPASESFPLQPRSYVSLVGSGPTEVVIDAAGEAEVFRLTYSCCVLFSGVTITGGAGYMGGGIHMRLCDDCRVENSVIRGNRATFGGGLWVAWIVSKQGGYGRFLELTDCIISDNYATLSSGGMCIMKADKVTVKRCLISSNVSPAGAGIAVGWGSLELVDSVIADNIAEIGDYQKRCLGAGVFVNFSGSPGLSFEAVNCLFNSNQNLCGAVGALYILLPEEGVAGLSGCTFAANTARDGNPALCIEVGEDHSLAAVEVTDCIFRDGGDEIWEEVPGLVVVENSCVEGGWDGAGDGNFDADPLFETGPLGNYYLSQTEAGQEEESPCVDAGSMTAAEAGMDMRTTRTDGAPDTGVVDIGYHYPTLFMLPEVWVSTPSDTYSHGDTMEVVFEAINPNPFSYPVDLFSSLELPANFTFGPATLLTIELPSAAPPISEPGTYWVAAAFAHVGTTSFIGEPNLHQ